MYGFTTGGKTVSVFPSQVSGAPIIYLNTVAGEGAEVFEAVRQNGCLPFTLVVISGLNWNHDMSPWVSPPAFHNAAPCTGGADSYLRLLTDVIVPAVEKGLLGVPCWRGIAGYSLAGLFALYAIYRTDLFSRVGSMSGSLWFPGLRKYICAREPERRPDCVYFSLGDREDKVRNAMLKTVRQNTEEICACYRAKGIDTVLRLHPGNHYDHAVERIAAGIMWMLDR